MLVILAIAAAIGAIIPQTPTTPNADLVHRSYGTFWYGVIKLLRLNDVFHSWWFIALLALFSVNLAICTFRRLRTSIRVVSTPLQPRSNPYTDMAIPVVWAGTGLVLDKAREATRRVLKGERVRFREVGDQFIGDRWRYSRLGPDLVHLGIALILIGAVLSIFKSEGQIRLNDTQLGKVFQPCPEGLIKDCIKGAEFSIRVDDFGAEAYPNAAAYRDYWTVLTVIQDGKEVKTKRIGLNSPLTYKGISFYQSRYGYDLNAATVAFAGVVPGERRGLGSFTVRVGEWFRIPGTEHRVELVQFFTTLTLDRTGRPVNVNTPRPQNPAAILHIYREVGGLIELYYTDMIFANYPTPPFSRTKPYQFYIEGFHVPMFVGISYSRDPGYRVVWWGFVMVIVGLFGVFYLRPRRVWVLLDPAGERLLIHGEPRSSSGDESWLGRLAREIKRQLPEGGCSS